jgi:hypothetical protein
MIAEKMKIFVILGFSSCIHCAADFLQKLIRLEIGGRLIGACFLWTKVDKAACATAVSCECTTAFLGPFSSIGGGCGRFVVTPGVTEALYTDINTVFLVLNDYNKSKDLMINNLKIKNNIVFRKKIRD